MSSCKYCNSKLGKQHPYAKIQNDAGEWVHPDCGLKEIGVKFLDEFSAQQLFAWFPIGLACEHGVIEELTKRTHTNGEPPKSFNELLDT